MALELYAHPFSSFCQKAIIALYEAGTPFELKMLDAEHPENFEALKAAWPFGRFPALQDGDRWVMEATCIIEYLDVHHPGAERMIPEDCDLALQVRFLDRVFDSDVSGQQQALIYNALRPEGSRDPYGEAKARERLEVAYAWLDAMLVGREWAIGDRFTLADCAAGPALFYAHWTHPIDARFETLLAYRRRLMARPSFARAIEEARPYRDYFPLGVLAED